MRISPAHMFRAWCLNISVEWRHCGRILSQLVGFMEAVCLLVKAILMLNLIIFSSLSREGVSNNFNTLTTGNGLGMRL